MIIIGPNDTNIRFLNIMQSEIIIVLGTDFYYDFVEQFNSNTSKLDTLNMSTDK